MALPPKWQSDPHADPHLGHKEEGRTICLHSLAVLPEYQNQGLGKTLVLSYIQRIQSAGVVDRIALLTYDRLVPFYERLGFEYRGKSKAQYGGGGWNDMVRASPLPVILFDIFSCLVSPLYPDLSLTS